MKTEAYKEGYSAYFDDAKIIDNPYPYGSREGDEWEDGWIDASWDD